MRRRISRYVLRAEPSMLIYKIYLGSCWFRTDEGSGGRTDLKRTNAVLELLSPSPSYIMIQVFVYFHLLENTPRYLKRLN